MDIKELKQELARLRDMDTPPAVVKEHEDLLKKKMKAVLKNKSKKWDTDNQCWVEDPAGLPPPESEEAPAPQQGITIVLNIGGFGGKEK